MDRKSPRVALSGRPSSGIAAVGEDVAANRRESGLVGNMSIQATIQNLAHEQERVQKKTFTNWMNTYLCKSSPPVKIDDLFEAIRDGTNLILLLQVLSGTKLSMERGPRLKRVHHLSNISTALKFLESKHIKLVNINATDIADGKPSIVLGLIWTIILYFQIEETATKMAEQTPSKKMSAMDKFRVSAKKALLEYTTNAIAKRYNLSIKDFHTSWRDGIAFNAMIHNIRPELVDIDEVYHRTPRVNLENAFSTAEAHLGIPRLIDPEDVDVEKPDEKSIMTYVAQFMKAYPDAGEDPANRKRALAPSDSEMKEYGDLMTWIGEAEEVLKVVDEPLVDLQQEYMDYLNFKANYDRNADIVKRLDEKVRNNTALKITGTQWSALMERWNATAANTRAWLVKLDAALPGKLGKLSLWLHEAEAFMEVTAQTPDTVDQIQTILSQHSKIFADLDTHNQLLVQVKRAGRYEGQFIYQPHLDEICRRFAAIHESAPVREKLLLLEEQKIRLAAFAGDAERGASECCGKPGSLEDVRAKLEQIKNLERVDKIGMNYEKIVNEMKKRCDAYKKLKGHDKSIVEDRNAFLQDTGERWKNMTSQLATAAANLENVGEQWQRYLGSIQPLSQWISEGEAVLLRSLPEKQEYFSDLKPWEDRHRVMNDSAQHLIAHCEQLTSDEVANELSLMNGRYDNLLESMRKMHQEEVVDRAKQNYNDGVERIQTWLTDAETLMNQEVPCVHSALKEYLLKLDAMNSDIVQLESEFKVTTKTAQSLVKDSSQDDVNSMLETLNQQKEIIVRMRKEIPDKIKHVKSVLPNVESLETGLLDLNNWLDNGETVLGSNKLDGSAQSADARLEKHKAFFAETMYQKSILESKSKVFQKVLSSKPKLKNVNFEPLEKSMESTQHRFQSCISASKDWEMKLENLSRLWRSVSQKKRVIDDWMDQADLVLNDREDDVESLIHKHKIFFEKSDTDMWDNYAQATGDILKLVDVDDQSELQDSMKELENKYKAVLSKAPIHLTRLEFEQQEEKFMQKAEMAEKTLTAQQHQLSRNDNVKEVLRKHREIFHDSDFFTTCKSYLDNMHTCVVTISKLDPDDTNMEELYDEHLRRWRFLQVAVDTTYNDLKQLPERWKDYNRKLQEFSTWINNTESLMGNLQNESLTNDEYQEAKARFQDVMRNLSRYNGDRDWLEQNLDELIKDAPEADAVRQRQQLETLLSKFASLQPELGSVGDKSSIFSKCYEYKEGVDRRHQWLVETQRLVMEQPYVDGLQEARALLQDHEHLIARLDSEQKSVEADLEMGRQLESSGNTPAFVSATIRDLDKMWSDTNTMAKDKHDKLKQLLTNWQDYEGEKTSILQYLKLAETEIDKPAPLAGQQLAQQDHQSKKELQATLDKLKDNLSDMQKLNSLLVDGASDDRQRDLRGEVSQIDKRLESIATRLNMKLADLETMIARWNEYYKRLNSFSDWLAEKESKLAEVDQSTVLPEDKLSEASVITNDVYGNNLTLENLEKDARGLSQNFRSRETAALKSKLTSLRRQWEALCSRATDRSSSLTHSVTHWNTFQSAAQQLVPWIETAEKHLSSALPQCGSLEEAQEVYDSHQTFLRECEEHFPLFEKMSTEAGYILDQPGVSSSLEDTQKRWASIISASEERTHKLDKMHGAWYAYDSEKQSFTETVAKIEARLNVPSGCHSVDMQVLEHEVALSKALQEEIRSNQPQFNALQRQLEQLQGHVSPVDAQLLSETHDELKSKWAEVVKMGAEKQSELSQSLQQRREFYGGLQDFEKWLKKMQRKLDAGGEIYSDEIGDVQAKLHAMDSECRGKDPVVTKLKSEFETLVANCNEDEKAGLENRFKNVMGSYDKVNELIDNRGVLCAEWTHYNSEHATLQSRLKQLQLKLESPDIQEEDMDEVLSELGAVRKDLANLSKQTDSCDELMSSAQMMIKDRASQRTLHFFSELQNLQTACDQVDYSSQQKRGHFEEISTLHDEFEAKKEQLLQRLDSVDGNVTGLAIGQCDIHGLRELIGELEDDLDGQNADYELLRDLGRQIMHGDPSKSAEIKDSLQRLSEKWDSSHKQVSEKQKQYRSAATLWQQYNDARQSVVKVIQDVNPMLSPTQVFTNPEDIGRALDSYKSTQLDLQTNQSQLDFMNVKGIELLEAVKSISNFDSLNLVRDLDNTNNEWEAATETLSTNKDSLEAQLACWDQFEVGAEEVGSWLNSVVAKLEDSLTNFDDSIAVETRLLKYKEDMPYMAEVLGTVGQKVSDFKSLNQDTELPKMAQQQAELIEKFDRLGVLAAKVEDVLSDFSCEQESLKADIEDESKWLMDVKTQLGGLDDVSGSDETIVARLQDCRALEANIDSHRQRISELRDKADALHSKYPSAETANLSKDATLLAKKFEAFRTRGEKIDELLSRTVEAHCEEASVDEQRWLAVAKEKTAWCSDVSGDQYNVEAKLATINDLLANVEVGERKKEAAAIKRDIIKGVTSPNRQSEIEQQKNARLQDWKSLTTDMENTKIKLENSLSKWKQYETQCENLSSWLKVNENDVRSSSSLKPDLSGKKEQLEQLKQLEKDVIAHRPDFQHIQDEATDIKRMTGDGRPLTSTTQLAARFQTLVSSVHDALERAELNVEHHTQYHKKRSAFQAWLRDAHEQLDSCKQTAVDGDALTQQLSVIQAMMDNKDQGLAKFSATLEAGERLYPNTSNEGREVIRNELRSIRDEWEAFIDTLNDTYRSLNSRRMQWTSFDENYDEIQKWVAEVSEQFVGDYPYKDTLQEKKSLANYYKTRFQDVQSHQSTVDGLMDKGRSLSSTVAKSRFDDLSSQYSKLFTITQEYVKMSEEHVTQHQRLSDTYEQCHDTLAALSDKLSVCAELSTDKHSLHTRLEKTDGIIAALKTDVIPVDDVKLLAETVIPQTAENGAAAISSDCDKLETFRREVTDKTGTVHASLSRALERLEQYDAAFDSLSRWLRDVEDEVKDVELKAQLSEKSMQVEALMKVQSDIDEKKGDFDNFSKLTADINTDNRLTSQSSQLASRYSNLLLTTQEAITRWIEFEDEHRAYETSLFRSLDWVQTMKERLEMCNNVMGQKADVEDRLAKIQELIGERESGEAEHIHKTVEMGEKLYPSTSSDGRNIIRQDLRKLREEWELVTDDMTETRRKLEAILVDWSSHTEAHQHVQKWLDDTETSLRDNAGLRATIEEKKAQLQTHKASHRDVLSHVHVVEGLVEKAHALSQQLTQNDTVARPATHLHKRYHDLCDESRAALDRYNSAVHQHHAMNEACRDFTDWLTTSRDKLSACSDANRDKISVLNTIGRLKEYSEQMQYGENKMSILKELCTKVAGQSSQLGKDAVFNNCNDLQNQLHKYAQNLDDAKIGFDAALHEWKEFDASFHDLSVWLKDAEHKAKEQEPVATLAEKHTRLEKLQAFRQEALKMQPAFDSFWDKAQSLTSRDARLAAKVTQLKDNYQHLLTQLKDSVAKSTTMCEEHAVFEQKYKEFVDWLSHAEQQLENCNKPSIHQADLHDKHVFIQNLLEDKDFGLQKLNEMVEAGERLYPNTASSGREIVRQMLRTGKEDWESLFSSLCEAQSRIDDAVGRWTSFSDGWNELEMWMNDIEKKLSDESTEKDSLKEKVALLKRFKDMQEDVASHQRQVDAVVEKAQMASHVITDSDMAAFITTCNARYEHIVSTIKALVHEHGLHVQTHQQFEESLTTFTEMLNGLNERLTSCHDTTGDRYSIQSKLDRLKDLLAMEPDGAFRLDTCRTLGEVTMQNTGEVGRKRIADQLHLAETSWNEAMKDASDAKTNLDNVLEHWRLYEEKQAELCDWLKEQERSVKDFPLKDTLDEKIALCEKYKNVSRELSARQDEIDAFCDAAETVRRETGEGRVATQVSQLVTRHHTLIATVKDILKKCEQNVADHKCHEVHLSACTRWLNDAQEVYKKNSTVTGTQEEMQLKLEALQDALETRQAGFTLLRHATESGDKLYPNTAPEGRDIVRKNLRSLNAQFDQLFDDLAVSQRQLDSALLQWTSFDESRQQVMSWLTDMEREVSGEVTLVSTLEEKKSLAQKYKVCYQDATSYQRVVDSVTDKAQSVSHIQSAHHVDHFMTSTTQRYHEICATLKERMDLYAAFVVEHQSYTDAYMNCVESLNSTRAKFTTCADVTGDKVAVQARLDKIQDIMSSRDECEQKVRQVESSCDEVTQHTATPGQNAILDETRMLRTDWDALIASATKAQLDLEGCSVQWQDFEHCHETCSDDLHSLEHRLKQVEHVATLSAKRDMLDSVNKLTSDLVAAQPRLERLRELSQNLAAVSHESRIISQSAQLNNKHQTLAIKAKELQQNWQQYVQHHETFDASYKICLDWLSDVNERFTQIMNTDSEHDSIEGKLAEIKRLHTEKDGGLDKLQVTHESVQIVLPNTSIQGGDEIRLKMQDLQIQFDEFTVRLSDTISELESCVNQLTAYKVITAQLNRWLNDLESKLSGEFQLQSTFEEKKLQLERVKMLQLTIASHKCNVDAVKEQAKNFKNLHDECQAVEEVTIISNRYEVLVENSEKLHATCEMYINDHLVFRDVFLELSDWNMSIIEQLTMCSDIRGDRASLELHEAKLNGLIAKLDDGRKMLENLVSSSDVVKPQTSVAGQEMIMADLDTVKRDFSQIESDIENLKHVLSSLLKQWDEFDQHYAELSEWIENLNSDMKSYSENRTTYDEKVLQLQKQKSLHETILEKQSSLDLLTTQAQLLLQSSADSRIMAQLTQIASAYNSLVTSSKYYLKRYKQSVKDHQQYRDSYSDARKWIESAREQLDVTLDSDGDKAITEAQLEKLQEFSVTKDEGQLLVHSANTWADVTMSMTSDSGIDTLRSEIDELQMEWDSLLSQASDDKVKAETKLIRWNDLDANVTHILKWLGDTDRKLRAPQLCSDLPEKKAKLEAVKTLHRDVMSYQQVIDSALAKAADLGDDTGPEMDAKLGTITDKYNHITLTAQELLTQTEASVDSHRTYHDASVNFGVWTRATKDKIAAISDIHGDKAVIQAKIDKAQALLADLPEGSRLLDEVRAASSAALNSTSPSGQSKLRQEVDAMTDEYNNIRSALEENLTKLDACDEKWRDYTDVCDKFSTWLKGAEDVVNVSPDLMSSCVEKKQHSRQYQQYLSDVTNKQESLNKVKYAAQSLTEVNPNANTSQTVIQLGTRYQSLFTKCKETAAKLENRYQDHVSYDENLDKFTKWLKDKHRELENLKDTSGSKDDVAYCLKSVKELQTEIEGGQARLRILSDISDQVLPNTNAVGCQQIDKDTTDARDSYETLRSEVMQCKQLVEGTLNDWNEFARLQSHINEWMAGTDAKINADEEFKSDVVEKKSHLDKVKAIQQDIESHEDLLKKVEAQATKLGDDTALKNVADIRRHYQTLLDTTLDKVDKMEDQVNSHEDFRMSYKGSVDWLTGIKKKLHELNNCSGDKATLEARLRAIQELRGDMATGEEQVKNTDQLGEVLCETTGARGQEVIRRDLEALADDWNRLVAFIEESETNLESAVGDWDKYEDGISVMKKWIQETDDGIKDLLVPVSDLVEKDQRHKDGQALLGEIVAGKARVDDLRQDIEIVSRKSGDPAVGDSFMNVSSAYQTLLAAAKNMVHILEENCRDHREYDASYDACVKWLTDTTDRVRQCHDPTGDWHSVAQRVDSIKDITSAMDDGLNKVNECCDLAEKILPSTAVAGKKNIEKQITKLTNDWEELNETISATSSSLENVQQKWHDYEETYGGLVQWMNEVEGQVMAEQDPVAQLVERKTQLDKFKNLLADIGAHKTSLEQLGMRVDDLQTLSANPALSQSHRELSNRYETLRLTAQNRCGSLEREYDEHLAYHEGQQACEKWLLQTSFKVMSHNGLDVRSLELTEQQIIKHKNLLKEIDDYQPILQQTIHRGRRLLETVSHQPKFSQQLQAEILNLSESYQNLQLSGVQIKNRLDDTLSKWQDYKALLEQHHDFLALDVPQWLEEANANVPDDLQDAHHQLGATKGMNDRLLAIKQEITNAAHRCESIGSGDASIESQNVESGVSQLSDQVTAMLEDALEQMDQRMTRLRCVIDQWEGVDEERATLCDWLHAKQEEVSELEHTSAKLHPDAADMEIKKLKILRDEVTQRGDAVNTFIERFNTLTQHNPDLANPVVQAVQDDWQELLSHIDNLITDKEHNLQKAREFDTRFGEADDDLDLLMKELDSIDQLDASMDEKAKKASRTRRRQLKSRGTQTRFQPSARASNRSYTLGSDNSDDDANFGSRNLRGYRRGPGHKFNGSRSSLRSPSPHFSGRSPKTKHHGSHKSVAAESDTDDESGYGETLTAHASSFDTQDEMMSVMSYTPRGAAAAASYAGYESDNASTISYRSDCFKPLDPADCRNVACQTISHTGTQTPARFQHNVSYDDFRNSIRTIDHLTEEISELRQQSASRDMVTQTSRDSITQTDDADMYASMNSLSTQTKKKKKKGIRSELLKNILSEVKGIKASRGLDASRSSSISDVSEPVSTTSSVDPTSLRRLLTDVRTIREVDSHADISTQTAVEQGTQTSRSLFPEGDAVRIAREGRLNNLMGDIQIMQDETAEPIRTARDIESGNLRQRNASPIKRDKDKSRQAKQEASPEYTTSSGEDYIPPSYTQQVYHPVPRPKRRVKPEDVQAIQDRLGRLRDYQMPKKRATHERTRPPQTAVEPPIPVPFYMLPNGSFVPASYVTPAVINGAAGYLASNNGAPLSNPMGQPYVLAPFQVASPPKRERRRRPKPRYNVREFMRFYDDMDIPTSETERRRIRRRSDSNSDSLSGIMNRYHLDGALSQAENTARQLRQISSQMKKSLRDELSRL